MDVPPGHKLWRLQRPRGSDALDPELRDGPREGDVLMERGPKIGTRLWRIVETIDKVKLRWCVCVTETAAGVVREDVVWTLTRG